MIATSPKPDLKVRLAKLLQTVSASRLNTFHTCRLQFYFRYVMEIASASTPARHVGSAVHHVLSIWIKVGDFDERGLLPPVPGRTHADGQPGRDAG